MIYDDQILSDLFFGQRDRVKHRDCTQGEKREWHPVRWSQLVLMVGVQGGKVLQHRDFADLRVTGVEDNAVRHEKHASAEDNE